MGDYLSSDGVFKSLKDFSSNHDPRVYWKLQLRSAPELASLLLRIYAFPVQTAAVERLWSQLGSVLIKVRNRTAFDKAFRIAKVRAMIQRLRNLQLAEAAATKAAAGPQPQRCMTRTAQASSSADDATAERLAALEAAVLEAAEDAGADLITGVFPLPPLDAVHIMQFVLYQVVQFV